MRTSLGAALALDASAHLGWAQAPAVVGAPRGQPNFAAGNQAVSVYANLSAPLATIPADFVGISFENQVMTYGGYLTASNTTLISLLQKLGASGSVRVGGASQETATPPPLTQAMANNLAAFVSAIGSGWSVNYGLDAMAASSSAAATQATYLYNALGSKLTLQYGNEPIITNNFTAATYEAMWNAYDAAVLAAVPSAKRAATDDFYPYIQSIVAALTPGVSGLAEITQHFYYSPCLSINVDPQAVLSSPISAQVVTYNQAWALPSSKLAMTESNSICGGTGTPSGMTDRLLAAAWFVNTAIALASTGWSAINVHDYIGHSGWPTSSFVGPNGNSYYNPAWLNADGTWQAGSVFYGMYLFAQIEGQQQVQSTITSAGGVTLVNAIATVRATGKANILIVNYDARHPITVTPQQSAAWTTANVLLLAGSSCLDPSPTVGGATIGVGGAWSGSTTSISNGQSITLTPCESVLVSVN